MLFYTYTSRTRVYDLILFDITCIHIILYYIAKCRLKIIIMSHIYSLGRRIIRVRINIRLYIIIIKLNCANQTRNVHIISFALSRIYKWIGEFVRD